MFEHFGAQIREPQASRRAVQEADAELIFQFGDATAHGRNRHAEPARRFGKALSFNHFGEHYECIQVGHRLSISGNLIPGFPG